MSGSFCADVPVADLVCFTDLFKNGGVGGQTSYRQMNILEIQHSSTAESTKTTNQSQLGGNVKLRRRKM